MNKSIAHNAVADAIRAGVLPRPTQCEACSATSGTIVYHHPEDSYEPGRHLIVIPLCRSCHMLVHSGRIPEPRTGNVWRRVRQSIQPNMNRVPLYLDDAELAYLDQIRGIDTRSHAIRRVLREKMALAARPAPSVEVTAEWKRVGEALLTAKPCRCTVPPSGTSLCLVCGGV